MGVLIGEKLKDSQAASTRNARNAISSTGT
jgi:hypothetical protein